MKKLNVYALRSFTLLTLRGHHEFKEMSLCLFVVCPDLTLAMYAKIKLSQIVSK